MFKQLFAAAALVMGLAFFNLVSAQCGPDEVLFENHTPCEKEVTVYYGHPCTISGSISATLPPGYSIACVPIPGEFKPIEYEILDVSTGNTAVVVNPICGAPQQSFYMDCEDMCNLLEWVHDYHIVNLPD